MLTAEDESGEEEAEADVRQQPRRDRDRGQERFDRGDRPDRGERQARANGASREERVEEQSEERIALGVRPPSIGATDAESAEEAPKPRRRGRKPRAEDDSDEIAPAA